MITTVLSNVEILQKTDELNEYIMSSDLFRHYIETKKAVQRDAKAQQYVKEFVKLKEKFEEVERFGKYHPDYKTVRRQVRSYKREMDMYPIIADFKKAENDLQDLLIEISQIIANAVSPNIKVPTGNPFFDQMSCGGGCRTGGGCGCKTN